MPFDLSKSYSFTEQGISALNPDQQGVYGITNSQSQFIYVGQAEDLRKRLLEHFNRLSKQSGCIWEYAPALFYAHLVGANVDEVETEYINFYDPPCNRTN